MNRYEITIEADDNQITLFALDKGWQAEVQDPTDLARVEAEIAAYELDNTLTVDSVVKTLPNPTTAEEYAMQYMRDLVAGELKDSANKYYTKKSQASLERLLGAVNSAMSNQVAISKIVVPVV